MYKQRWQKKDGEVLAGKRGVAGTYDVEEEDITDEGEPPASATLSEYGSTAMGNSV